MPPANPAPALPWGRDDRPAAADDEGQREGPKRARTDAGPAVLEQPEGPPSAAACLSLDAVNLSEGARVEVKWVVEQDNGDKEKRWWGAKVIGPSDEADKAGGDKECRTYNILYDAWGEFEQETARVSFLASRLLYDHGCTAHDEGYLRWRMEGEELDSDEEGEEEDEAALLAAEVTMQELQRELAADPENEELERQAMDELSALPADRQHHIAAGFRDMVDRVREGLAAIAGQGGGDRAITKQDIESIFHGLRRP